jgi:hypothetical protein
MWPHRAKQAAELRAHAAVTVTPLCTRWHTHRCKEVEPQTHTTLYIDFLQIIKCHRYRHLHIFTWEVGALGPPLAQGEHKVITRPSIDTR